MPPDPSSIRFYFDNDVSAKVANLLAAKGHDVVSARTLDLRSATDAEHLLNVALSNRILVSHNFEDYELLHDAWQRWSEAWQTQQLHQGVIIVPQGSHFGIDWRPEATAGELISFVGRYRTMTNRLVRRTGAGWIAYSRAGQQVIPP